MGLSFLLSFGGFKTFPHDVMNLSYKFGMGLLLIVQHLAYPFTHQNVKRDKKDDCVSGHGFCNRIIKALPNYCAFNPLEAFKYHIPEHFFGPEKSPTHYF